VAACRTPIVSAVGHETDFTLCDFAADVRAATPSNAAEIVVPVKADLVATLEQRRRSLHLALRRRREHFAQRVDVASRALVHQRQRFRDRRDHIAVRGPRRLAHLAALLERHSPVSRLVHTRGRLAGLTPRLRRAGTLLLSESRQGLRRAAETLHAMSPLAVLSRGYAIATPVDSDQPITSAAAIQAGDRLRLRFAAGAAIARVDDPEQGPPAEYTHS
jgi:exodeoxyribonuclease VII large subunit